MEFNLSTFFFEIINFLVLIWILQRLFYKPLLEVIAKRKQFIDQSLNDAKSLKQQAEQQCSLYENRQKLWEQEKQAAITALHRQLEAERKAHQEKLNADFEQERQRANVLLSKQQRELQEQSEKQALLNGAKFAAMLLSQSAGPELEARLFTLLLDNLTTLPEACRQCLTAQGNKKSVAVKITSAYPLSAEMGQQLEQKLGALTGNSLNFQYHQDNALIAGLRIDIGAWVLNANLQHELTGFAEIANGQD
ncbi:F0F1 ATP synthase subunit delta [Candidatus Methylobacter oryzae]|uniref:ATP synthase subunit b n=1 Tax=Candidatus Methylobacter oryzae TaxID=2497749 RepID=A0ABY3CGK0_9GAMM|nr:F0F1 ATP synthase subunit delta [Candidatus Methylobacter oryzae]TRX03014.1 F0F1 ATP synthase subunit B [Candidatus Methylobacter oryzae]